MLCYIYCSVLFNFVVFCSVLLHLATPMCQCGHNRPCHFPTIFVGSRSCATLARSIFFAFGTLLVPPKATLAM